MMAEVSFYLVSRVNKPAIMQHSPLSFLCSSPKIQYAYIIVIDVTGQRGGVNAN